MGSDLPHVRKILLWGRELLLRGLMYKIGDGSSIKIAIDLWLPKRNTFKPILVNPCFKDSFVANFLLYSGQWKVPLLQKAFSMEDCEAIKGIPTWIVSSGILTKKKTTLLKVGINCF